METVTGIERDDTDLLENPHRRAIYETIRADPGRCLTVVSEESDVALSTARHHLRVLEEEGLIRSTLVRGKRRYVPVGDHDVELQAALDDSATRAVLETLAAIGPATNGRIADELDRDPSTVSHHLSALEDDGLVVRERDGRSVVNELHSTVEAVLRVDPQPSDNQSVPEVV